MKPCQSRASHPLANLRRGCGTSVASCSPDRSRTLHQCRSYEVVLRAHVRVHDFLHKSHTLYLMVVSKRTLIFSLVDWVCRLACIPNTTADACRHTCSRPDTCPCRLSLRACPANLFTHPRWGEETFQQTSMLHKNTWHAHYSRMRIHE